ncbi:MAG: AAA family ATPase [Lachnospiraceae bacterium]|nr:AAA family ATPase [Lachnospiraceae bacterium]
MQRNRKTATKLLLVQWSRFQNECICLEGSTLFTGVNGSGKSTILDAMTYLLTGNTQFNKAAKDRDRTVTAYVRGDTKSNGTERYLRNGEIVSYIAMEFWSPVERSYLVVGVCIESASEISCKSSWFVCRDTRLEQMNFTAVENKRIRFTPRNELAANGQKLKSGDFLGRDRGVEQVLRALGLRCDAAKYRSRLLKMMAFNPENNIDQFIQECVLEPGRVDSLKELREQKRQFERIRELYENLRSSKVQLETVESKTAEYEKKLRNLQIRELMLCYQELREREEAEKEIQERLAALEHKQAGLENRKKELDERYEAAGERYRIAENNDIFRDMQDSVRALKSQKERLKEETRRYEEKLAALKKLQLQLSDILQWAGAFLDVDEGDRRYLCRLAEREYDEEKKRAIFLRFAKQIREQNKIFNREVVHCEDRQKQLQGEMNELEEKIKLLKANQLVFPEAVREAKRKLQEEFRQMGIHTDVRIFAELVQEVKDREWRAAIETFLGRKRFYLIVDGLYCLKAMEILEQKGIHGANVVITDKLPETEVTPGSAAQMLVVPNLYARRYANYLLNGIHLCSSLEELHEHPKGGLTRNGMLAKSYAVSNMELKKTSLFLGGDSIRYQLKSAEEAKREKEAQLHANEKTLRQCEKYQDEIGRVDWDVSRYDFGAAKLLAESVERSERLQRDIDRIQSNPDFVAVLQEQQDAKREYEALKAAVEVISQEIGSCKRDQEAKSEDLKRISGELHVHNKEYSEKCLQHLELKRPMLEEYERLVKGRADTWKVITPKTVRNLEGEVKECVRQMEDAQLSYCKLAETDINKRGVGYIPFYRQEYRNIANIKVEEAHNQLKEQGEKLESAFMNDFVAEINETVREARAEIEGINRELRQIPFGNDTYRFVMEEKPDRSVFFRICKRLEYYLDSPEAYMNSARDDEEMEHDIQEFMSVILEEEDETEYTDYRRYFVYDMKIISRQGGQEIVADLSKKQGSASNGEKQTPYFIILAASLLQYYPPQACCARLAFIDEAFSALSRERIEQMVKYFEENHFQVFYAAPPEKIGSIGTFIESTVSLVTSGRYTHAVEGLVRG